MKDFKSSCSACNAKGWIQTSAYSSNYLMDGTEIIERCDECGFFNNDKAAANFAYQNNGVLFYSTIEAFQVLLTFSKN